VNVTRHHFKHMKRRLLSLLRQRRLQTANGCSKQSAAILWALHKAVLQAENSVRVLCISVHWDKYMLGSYLTQEEGGNFIP
jgi:hypothetical protein